MISVRNLSFRFQKFGSPLFENLSFEIESGTCTALVGASGTGKSTLANVLAGFLPPYEGEVFIDEIDCTSKPSRKVILTSQDCDLFPWQSVEAHLKFVMDGKSNHRIRSLLELVRLTGHERKFPNELSGGMKKRLSIARALAANPKLIIFDESFSSLDSDMRNDIHKDLVQILLVEKTTVLLITHDEADIKNLADAKICLANANPTYIE
jgi:ABC-type nitrate/sulfonate/bicarbonate transport system ATPase subunit